MADYNVNMKQWNGTSFDNVLPLAYNSHNAEQLGGQSLEEVQQWVKQWVEDMGLMLYTGQYTGTGTYGESNPISITFPFEVIAFITPQNFTDGHSSTPPTLVPVLLTSNLSSEYKSIYYYNEKKESLFMKISSDRKTISWYSTKSAYVQMNISDAIYRFAAIGGHDMGGQTEWVIDSSGSWTVPRTGRYMLELYGGGGGTSRRTDSSGYNGGASCQHYDSISLTKGDTINIVVGSGVKGQNAGETTSFGSYSVSGGGGSSGKVAGAGAGNYGAAGKFLKANVAERNYGSGVFSKLYGYGPSNDLNKSGDGAVYIKYIGE